MTKSLFSRPRRRRRLRGGGCATSSLCSQRSRNSLSQSACFQKTCRQFLLLRGRLLLCCGCARSPNGSAASLVQCAKVNFGCQIRSADGASWRARAPPEHSSGFMRSSIALGDCFFTPLLGCSACQCEPGSGELLDVKLRRLPKLGVKSPSQPRVSIAGGNAMKGARVPGS